MLNLLKLFFIFVKIGAILLGGGYVILPILMNEFVEKRQLVTNDEMIDYYALSQSLPGIVAVNISIFVGYRIYKEIGAITALLGMILCPFICIVFLASFFCKIVGNTYIQGMFWGVGISVIALIILTVREFWQNVERNEYFYIIFTTSLIALVFFKLTPIQVILLFLMIGLFIKRVTGGRV